VKTRSKTAEDRRAEIQANATLLGIDDGYISTLVDTFYENVRSDSRIGPLFDNVIGENWGPHLAKMKDFWASVAYNAGRYSGKPVPKHQELAEVTPGHFSIWLEIFEYTLKDTAPNPDVVPFMMEKATRIAQSLQYAMFGMRGLPGSKW